MASQLLELNTNSIRLNGLFFLDSIGTKAFDNVSTVTVTLQKDGADIGGETWPLAVPYVATTDGIYYTAFSDSIVIAEGDVISVIVNSTSINAKGNWNESVTVYTRKLDGEP